MSDNTLMSFIASFCRNCAHESGMRSTLVDTISVALVSIARNGVGFFIICLGFAGDISSIKLPSRS